MNAKTNLSVATASDSQSKLPITKRVVKFDYQDIDKPVFYFDNAAISALWVGLSATFPLGEGEFIRSVKNFEDQITDKQLQEDVANFSAQEAHHSLQHKKMNKQFDATGFSTADIEVLMQEELDKRAKKWSHMKRLRRTVCAEHITATFAHYALKHPDVLDHAPESFKNVMLWHAIEEIEHKSVTFDVYKHCGGSMAALKMHYLWFAFLEFPFQMALITRHLLKTSGNKVTWKERWGMLKHLFGAKGMISSVFYLYLWFFKPGFHPWDHDDSDLINTWKTKLKPHYKEI
ncbi:MAG: metal-dependent hydrolase [Pseudomonadota bacterium]